MQHLALLTADMWSQWHDFHSYESSSYLEKLKKSIWQHCPSQTYDSWNQKHPTRGDTNPNICHSFKNAVCPKLLAFTLLTEITFLKSVTFVVCLASHFHFWSHPKVKVAHLPHQNLAATVCYCLVQFTKDIFKLRQQPEMCRTALYRPHASS